LSTGLTPRKFLIRHEVALAGKLKPPIDDEATADRNMVYAAIRDGGSGRGIPPEPPVQLGNLSDAEYRAYLRQIGINGF